MFIVADLVSLNLFSHTATANKVRMVHCLDCGSQDELLFLKIFYFFLKRSILSQQTVEIILTGSVLFAKVSV